MGLREEHFSQESVEETAKATSFLQIGGVSFIKDAS